MNGEAGSLIVHGRWAYFGMLAPQVCSVFFNDAPSYMVGSLYPYLFLLAEGLCAFACCWRAFGAKERRKPRGGLPEALCIVGVLLLLTGMQANSEAAMQGAALLAGAGVTLGYIQWLDRLAALDARHAIGYILLVFVFTGLLKLVALALSYGAYALLVVLAQGVSLVCERRLPREAQVSASESRPVPLSAYAPIAAEFAVLSLTLGCLNGLARVEDTALVHILLRLVGTLALFVVLFVNRKPIDLVPLVQICLLIAIAGPLASALFPEQEKAMLAAGWCLMQILVFVVAVVVQGRSRRSPAELFGFGWGLFCTGIAIGYLVTRALPAVESTQRMVLVVVSVLSVITVYLLMRFQRTSSSLTISPVETSPPLADGRADTTARMIYLEESYQLTKRELEVMALLDRGLSKRRIAEELFVSENTVRMHVKNIYSKLGIHSKQELIAIIDGVTQPPVPPMSSKDTAEESSI